MKIKADTPEEYISMLPESRKAVFKTLRDTVLKNLPTGFEEQISYGMIGYVVPQSLYPGGYHVNPKLPLPFINIASQKNFIAMYHMGLYADKALMSWFTTEYSNQSGAEPDMGKSCIRFKKMDQIPFKLIGELISRISAEDWIMLYESQLRK